MGLKELNETHDPYLRSERWKPATSVERWLALIALVTAVAICLVSWGIVESLDM